jgi:hypothetical protein
MLRIFFLDLVDLHESVASCCRSRFGLVLKDGTLVCIVFHQSVIRLIRRRFRSDRFEKNWSRFHALNHRLPLWSSEPDHDRPMPDGILLALPGPSPACGL